MEITIAQAIEKLSIIDAAITDALANEVAEAAVEAVQKSAKDNVYDAYSGPMAAFRRGENGGLLDPHNIITIAEGNTLTISNVAGLQNRFYPEGAQKDPSRLTPIIEEGLKAYHQPRPRPFMQHAKDILISGTAENALRRGLARQGIEITNGITFTAE